MFLRKKKPTPSGKATKSPVLPSANKAFIWSRDFGYCALVVLFFYSLGEATNFKTFIDMLGMVLALAFASFAVGGIVGFLFGIPHSAQSNPRSDATTPPPAGLGGAQKQLPPAQNPPPGAAPAPTPQTSAPAANPAGSNGSDFKPSTNLEQIADWLTKIIVGVGLTQIHKAIPLFNQLCVAIGAALDPYMKGGGRHGAPVAGTILLLFSILGFLIVYLWTYLYLIGIQKSLANEIIDTISGQIQDSDQNDKYAIDLANTQLNLSEGATDLPVDDLVAAFSYASASVISYIFFRAVNNRKQYWNTKETFRVGRTVPIFQAFIRMDTNFEFPENYAELAYALKDKANPDYAEALKNLDVAINGFREGNQVIKIAMLYFNRAYCRIQLDANFKLNQPSAEAAKTLIQADLTEAAKDPIIGNVITTDPVINNWKKVNP